MQGLPILIFFVIVVVNVISWIKKQQALQQGGDDDQLAPGPTQPGQLTDETPGRRLSPLEEAFRQFTRPLEMQPPKPARTIPHIKVKPEPAEAEKENKYIVPRRAKPKRAAVSSPKKPVSKNIWANGIIMSEILRPPLAKRGGHHQMWK